MKRYNLFIPPAEVRDIPGHQWKASEMNLYKNWLLESSSSRIDKLFEYLSLNKESAQLHTIGKSVENLLQNPQFYNGTDITNECYALFADIGLYIATDLLIKHPEITWDTLKKPKSDIWYGLPVLYSKDKAQYCDPIYLSVVCGKKVSDGDIAGEKAWVNLYNQIESQLTAG